MRYDAIEPAVFLERPNRFIAYVKTARGREICHVKNTGRCRELLQPGAVIYVNRSDVPGRKTPLDLICVEKSEDPAGDGIPRLINMDSQAPNQVVKEFLEAGNLFENCTLIRPEYTWGESRFDFYVEADALPDDQSGDEPGTRSDDQPGDEPGIRSDDQPGDEPGIRSDCRKILLEVKGITLERGGYACFPDAPTERGVKHLRELTAAVKAGYEAWLFFVIQMESIAGVYPNDRTDPVFGEALWEAMEAGVKVAAYSCAVTEDSLQITEPVPVFTDEETARLHACVGPLRDWFRREARNLPWREREGVYRPGPYEIWVSEIMLQQTRVEAVKGYYARFMERLPDIRHLAEVPEDELLKLWEGLGYYNRVRNMQKAARVIMEQYGGRFPESFDEILALPGIGTYTAGAISSNAFELREPAVDGNVLRVTARLLGSREDIASPAVKRKREIQIRQILPAQKPGLFNQALMELGACVCVPNGMPECSRCPLQALCSAYRDGLTDQIPVKAPKKERRMEKRTILLIRDGRRVLIERRPTKGLLAGLYEFVNLPGHLTEKEAAQAAEDLGLEPLYVEKLDAAKHIFSHVEWHMEGYMIRVADPAATEGSGESAVRSGTTVGEVRGTELPAGMLFADTQTVQEQYAIPSAFRAFTDRLTILQGKDAL